METTPSRAAFFYCPERKDKPMTRINKSKDGRIGPEPKPGIILPPSGSTAGTTTGTVGAAPKSKKKKNFQPVMKAKKTKK